MAWDCPRCEYSAEKYISFAHHWKAHDDDRRALVAAVGEDFLRDAYAEMSENQLSESLGVGRPTVRRALESCGIERRGPSESLEHMHENMTPEERLERVKDAHQARRTLPKLDVTARGYPRIRHQKEEVKHHRLLATLLVDDIRELRDKHVHHSEHPIWPDRADELNHAVNFLDNLEVLDESDHHELHYEEMEVDDDGKIRGKQQ